MPQLNPEFFISQLFWLTISFLFLFIFLWRISLPRINAVLNNRSNKINKDIKIAKKHQAEAEEIQKKIDTELKKAKIETSNLIKSANENIQIHANSELDKLDISLNLKLEEASSIIEKNKNKSIKIINEQIHEITKLTLSKISTLKVSDEDIKNVVNDIQEKAIN